MRRVRRPLLAVALTVPLGVAGLVGTGPPATAAIDCTELAAPRINQESYALARLGTQYAWGVATGKGVTVAVVDSGVDTDNLHFPGGTVLPGTSFVPRAPDPHADKWGHGTAVAGIIAAQSVEESKVYGLAFDAKILPVRVFVSEDRDDFEAPEWQEPNVAQMAAGIRWAAEQGADVINVSMSTGSPEPELKAAVAFAIRQDVVVVASGGNSSSGEDLTTVKGGTAEKTQYDVRYPAGLPGVIGVGASNTEDQITPATLAGPHIDVYAPGQAIPTAYYDKGDCALGPEPSSSYAAGFVSAEAALLREEFPEESAKEIGYRIKASADRPRRRERDDLRGWGLIAPYEALTMTIDPDRPGPQVPGATAPKTPQKAEAIEPLTAISDPLLPARQDLVWWTLFGGGFVVLAFLLRPLISRWLRRPSR